MGCRNTGSPLEAYSNICSNNSQSASDTLHAAYPNPFNPTTTIAFNLPVAGVVTLTACEVNGRQVDVLLQETLPAGRHQQAWDAASFPSGVYFIQMQTEGFRDMQRVLLLK